MLIVAGSISVDPADVEALSAAAVEMMKATHEEPGCIQYVFSVSMADPGEVEIFEVWESAEDLEAHFAMPHMAAFQAALGDVTITGRNLNRYEVASHEPM
jgi:quinol monooxygenase YgiN